MTTVKPRPRGDAVQLTEDDLRFLAVVFSKEQLSLELTSSMLIYAQLVPNPVHPPDACIRHPHLFHALTADLALFCSQADHRAGYTGAAAQFSKTSSSYMSSSLAHFGIRYQDNQTTQ